MPHRAVSVVSQTLRRYFTQRKVPTPKGASSVSKHRPDSPLAHAQRRLHDAVTALAEPTPIWEAGICRYSPPLYTRLRGSLRGQPTRLGRRVPSSRLPCRTDVLALLLDIDGTTARWHPHGKTTLDRLRELAAQDRRPQDCELLDDYRTRIEAWCHSAAELVADKPPEVALRLPCPSCGTRFIYRPSNGESVRTWALRVSEDGARCQSCDATWAPEQFEFLATLLGCPALPA